MKSAKSGTSVIDTGVCFPEGNIPGKCLFDAVTVGGSLAPNPIFTILFFSNEGKQILNSFKYFTGLSSLAEKIVIVQPVLTVKLVL